MLRKEVLCSISYYFKLIIDSLNNVNNPNANRFCKKREKIK